MRKTILAIPLLSIVCQASLGNECIEEGDEVTLQGSISTQTFPGRPNYESIEMGDEAETVEILKTNKDICIGGTYPDSEERYTLSGLSKFHLILNAPEHIKTTDASQSFIVTGHLQRAITGHHHTPVVIEVNKIDAKPDNLADVTHTKEQIKGADKSSIKTNQAIGSIRSDAKTTIFPSTQAPDYCVGFSSEACSRIKAVVKTNIRPSYCVAGYGLTDSGLNPEQIRICIATSPPLSPEMKRAEAKAMEKKNQIINDARAAVKESWTQYQVIIKTIETSYRCDVINAVSANLSILKIQEFMEDEKMKYGLIGDTNLSIKTYTTEAIQASKNEVEHGACEQITPASRGKIRSLVSDLMR